MSACFVRSSCPNCGPSSLFRYGVCVTLKCGYQLQPAPVTHPDFRRYNNQTSQQQAERNKRRSKKSHARRYEA